MKRSSSVMIAAAAMAGLLSGAAVQGTHGEEKAPKPGKEAPIKKAPKVIDCAGNNDCKGLGGCKSGDNGCKFKNSCKGKGGCHVTKKDIKAWEKKQKEKEKKA